MSGLGVRWYQRIAVRLALLIATALLLFTWLAPFLRAAAEYAIGLPSTETHLGVLHTGWIREELMAGGIEPNPECVERLSTELASKSVAFLWLSPAGRVLTRSPGLPWSVGDAWPYPTSTSQHIDLAGRSVPVMLTRVFEGDTELGKMVTITLDEQGHRTWHEEHGQSEEEMTRCVLCNVEHALLVDEHEYDLMLARREQIAFVSTLSLGILVAVLIGFASSWLVTRRLTRIAHQVVVSEQSGALPGPFDERARDEIGMLSRTMNRMRADLESRDKDRRDWIAQVSHDLRTPLTALVACLDRVTASLAGDVEAVKLVHTARRDAERVQSLAEDLLEIAKLDARIGGVEEPVPAGELLRCVVEDLHPWACSEGIELTATMETDMPLMTADGSRLLRALENMIRNAIQHAESHVQVAVRTRQLAIEFEALDDGPGFATDCTQIGKDLSAGIGLVVVRRVAEAHRGHCGAENLSPQGARVWFTIPIA